MSVWAGGLVEVWVENKDGNFCFEFQLSWAQGTRKRRACWLVVWFGFRLKEEIILCYNVLLLYYSKSH